MLDICAAYDSVWRDGLRYKIRNNFNIKGRMYWWIDSFLRERAGKVVLNGASSQLYNFRVGVPQGSALSPILFLLYINDLTDVIHHPIQSGMFADDVALWTSIFTEDTTEMQRQMELLQYSLNGVSEWGCKWKMALAPQKSQCITFRSKNKKKYPKLKIKLDNTDIKEKDQVKYLGLIIDSKLTYKQHLSLSVYKLLFKTIILPILEYGCPFWNGTSEVYKKKLERIQRIALCRILGVMSWTAYDTVNMMAQMPPLELRRQQEEVKLYHRCIQISEQLPEHNLTLAYRLWEQNHNVPENEFYCWRGKLSPLSRACIHAEEMKIPTITPDKKAIINKPPMQRKKIPCPNKSPFPQNAEPPAEEILTSINNKTTVIYTDGSAFPNPGIGGVGVIIQDQSNQEHVEIEHPVNGINKKGT
ncbi:hypothetical protein RFI_28612 [Reticulomyxa filosa]|uniref:Uncharacterized protein n=1 Tax=Reticulomyxa filosa TaxID=46433 RepID=X6M6X5_RETFI|nr:hypothetical protein RFI_28612 [Reticulomyxa filosa]|eukprot:ETO08780.1 hypothetical protein RFI_28612 [Reticulomyxa filosa]